MAPTHHRYTCTMQYSSCDVHTCHLARCNTPTNSWQLAWIIESEEQAQDGRLAAAAGADQCAAAAGRHAEGHALCRWEVNN